VSVNGVCLTAVAAADGVLDFDLVPETLRRSSLGGLSAGTAVNVEPALRAGEPLGGHLVQGHVDGVGRVSRADGEGLEIEAAPTILRYCVEKGSITVEGVSLTVAALGEGSFSVALVPHTRAATTLGAVAPGDEVNLEVDVIAKHVERLLEPR
jgi:riboflavin synthase